MNPPAVFRSPSLAPLCACTYHSCCCSPSTVFPEVLPAWKVLFKGYFSFLSLFPPPFEWEAKGL